MKPKLRYILKALFTPSLPAGPIGAAPPPRSPGYPVTYVPVARDARIDRPNVFDPALRQYSRAFRVGEPSFATREVATAWRAARRRAMGHVLRLVGQSRWRDQLVLRGSVVLKAWFPHAAREPGDLDYVVTPRSLRPTDPWAADFETGVSRLVREHPRVTGDAPIEFRADAIAVDDIWAYDRAPGRRLVFPWTADGLPGGAVQLDVVFGEALHAPPVQTHIPTGGGSSTLTVQTAGKELSLAWKLVWLERDCYPQGKDLYDAALLAEHARLPPDLLDRARRAAAAADGAAFHPLDPEFPMNLDVDWDEFRREYPWVRGDADEWLACLARALAPTFVPRVYGNS